ncbi:DNA polymerase III subunit alpha [Thermophagus xiamenensis]|uniref:DNA-directed DNA polymerase n=1 Tax=Thermophagus xiamenensis TaxID=385682 RepID=A0A1I2AKI2_9BACT|nr:DNA polymerase III subunit alpha [Thermophagus xiamenensis]SFE44422.1 DNA polymerase III, alpha subunit [Thermophagus xiamenensis]
MIAGKSYYSLRFGTLSPEELAATAAKQGIDVLILTDINNTTGIFEFVKACQQNKITPLVGIEFRNNSQWLYTGIAKNFKGFGELNRFLSHYRLQGQPLPANPPSFHDAIIVWPWGNKTPQQLKDNEYIGIRHFQLRQLLTSPWRNHQERILIWQPVVFNNRQDMELHRQLRAIDRNILLDRLSPDDLASPYDWMVPHQKLLKAFSDWPEIIKTTNTLLKQLSFDFSFEGSKNKQTYTGSRYDDEQLLAQLASDGLKERYGPDNVVARQRVEKELSIINKLGFAAYYLMVWDIIRYSLSHGFYHVGRGSGANSVVAYCLKITDVDPIELNLYFERFLNPKRSSPPDFDIDYSWKEREEVQNYIFKRYGRAHTALLGAVSTFQARAAIRELGKIYGLPREEIDQLVLQPRGFEPDNLGKMILKTAHRLAGFPNLRTIHAGGILISEAPITDYTALDMPPKGFSTTQWDMYTAEEIGFEKFDILSQRGIGHIRDCINIVYQNHGKNIDIHRIDDFKKDTKIKKLLQKGETTGCFYIESPAMRGLLKKLRCRDYLTLVAASSIIRPGVARSGMMREYIRRFHNPDSFEYAHPILKEQLSETFGIMVYQEDVIKVCHHFAGLDLADADVLRRAMSGKYRSRKAFQSIVDKFFANCHQRGYDKALTAEVWRQIESFAGYSFSKAHSASYAVESFQSLYLKAHYPLEFMVAVINNFGGFYATWLYVNEARRLGGIIHLPCVNKSQYMTSISGKDIYLGFIHVHDLEQKTALAIIKERNRNGVYHSLEDFVSRTGITREQLLLLIRLGAFRFTGKSKPQLLWEAHLLLSKEKKKKKAPRLFNPATQQYRLPQLQQQKLEDAYDEIELLGFPVSCSFFDMLKTSYRGELLARDLQHNVGRRVRMTGQLVTIKYVKTVKRQIMHFATFLDPDGEFFDTVHFPKVVKRWPFAGNGVYLIQGKIVSEFGYPSIEVEKMAPLPLRPDPRSE